MTTAKAKLHYFERVRREHSLLLSCACAAILFFSFPSSRGKWAAFDWSSDNTQPNEAEIDSALQEAATAALGQRDGAIIIMDPQTGRVRALVNPQTAFAQPMMPGSTMKPFTALAALESGLIEPNSRTVCPGRFTGVSFSLPCVHADHLPPFTPSQAIAYSCNYYFATLGQRLGRDKLIETVRRFGFGQPTGVSDQQEARGTLLPCEAGNNAKVRSGERAQADCGAREAIGESDHIQVTPVQLLTAYAALVNGGHLFQARSAGASEFLSTERASIEISPQHRTIITEGMRGAVRYGTAKNARLDSLPLYIIGKTGTSPPPKGYRPNGWFVGFVASNSTSGASVVEDAPAPDGMKLAVLVLLERSHGAEAAALSKSIFEAYAAAIARRGISNIPSKTSLETTTGSISSNSAIRDPQSAIVRVHLVTENITQELSLEDYVLGVMRAEGSMESEPEALKALAIAIRTFALKNHGRHAKDGYDFCSTTHCQRFVAGTASAAMIEAVKATEGQVLLDDRGQLAEAYFGASCGGETANIGRLWGTNPPTYLRGVRDEFCITGPHATWTDMITRADLLKALQSDARTNVGSRLDNVIIAKRDETGRAEFISLEGERHKIVRGWDFKIIVGRVLGWSVLKSSRFEVARTGSGFIFHGSGFGHGLGLCQEGAHVMAERGANYQRILERYFPGTSVNRAGWRADLLLENLPLPLGEGRGEGLATSPNPFSLISSSSGSEKQKEISFFHRSQAKPLTPALSHREREQQSYFAPSELANSLNPRAHKYFIRTGLKTNQRYLTISSEHFHVTYPADVDHRDANLVLNTLEAARADFSHRASAASVAIGDIPTLEIRINDSTGDFTARTGQPWWAAAATRGHRMELQPVGVLKRRGVLITTLRHELAHAFIDAVSHDRAPRWLEEGFAIYLAGEGQMIARYATKTKLPPDEIEKRLQRPGSQQEMRALYAEAYRAVLDLIRIGNETSVWKKLAAY